MSALDTVRRIPWSRRVVRWRGKKFAIAKKKALPVPYFDGDRLVTNRAAFLAAF